VTAGWDLRTHRHRYWLILIGEGSTMAVQMVAGRPVAA
jgi:hypothetical protein